MKFFASAFSGTHARWFRLSVAPILLTCLLGLALFSAGCSSDSGEINFPTPPEPEQMNWIFDVYGTAADDVYACGNKGAMFHYDGNDSNAWTYMEMGAGTPITTVWGPDDGTLYAAGHAGKLWQNIGGTWSSMSSGTSEDLFGLGMFDSTIHAVGKNGTVRRLNGNTWTGVGNEIVLRDAESLIAQDTLYLQLDIPSVVTVSQYFLGGAYNLPDFEGEYIGLAGTDGMVLAFDAEIDSITFEPVYDWRLRPVGNDQFSQSEWVTAASSSAPIIEDNYLGTSEGWIFRISQDDTSGGDTNNLVIVPMVPRVTSDSGSGIRDMWVDANHNLYFVTDDGEMGFQTSNYKFNEGIGMRKLFPVTHAGLTSIWGADTDHIFMSGFTENSLIHASMDFSDTSLVFTEVPLVFPNKGGQSIGMFEDHIGLPRY